MTGGLTLLGAGKHSTPAPAASVIQSIQKGSITIAAASLSNTATITGVDATKSILIFDGLTTTCTNQNQALRWATRIALTDGTTVTATRGNSSDAVTVNFTVIEFASGVNSIQSGTIVMSGAEASKTATISAVGANAFVLWLGASTAVVAMDVGVAQAAVELTDSTTVTAQCFLTSAMTVGYMVVDLDSTIVSGVRKVAQTSTSAATSYTATITSVDTTRSLVFPAGWIMASQLNANSICSARLTSATAVTFARNGTATTSRTHYCTVVEFAAAALKSNVQRGTIALAAATSNTATISAVVTAKSFVNSNWWNAVSGGNADPDVTEPTLDLTNTTTVTAAIAVSGTMTAAYEVMEFV